MCPPLGSVPLVGNSHGVVFAAEPTLGGTGTTYSCSLARGARFRLADVVELYFAYRPPAMAVAGRVIAYALEGTPPRHRQRHRSKLAATIRQPHLLEGRRTNPPGPLALNLAVDS